MLQAITRFFKALGYLITLQFDKFADQYANNPGVIGVRYDEIIRRKRASIDEYVSAVAQIEVLKEKNVALASELKKSISEYRDELEAIIEEGKKTDTESAQYTALMDEYNNIKSLLETQETRQQEIDKAVETYKDDLTNHKLSLQGLLDEVANLKKEKVSAVADMMSAREEEKIARVVAGLSTDTVDKELEEVRNARAESNARAKTAQDISGMDVKLKKQKRLGAIRSKKHTDEFSQLVEAAKKIDSVEQPAMEGKPALAEA